jgi:nicotinamide-nucleotide amidase
MHYSLDKIDLIKESLVQNKKTLAVAESVTSGHLQAAFSQAKNASDFFQGGITVYNYGQKCRHLHIEPIHALQCNCVSNEVASQMALGVVKMFSSDYGIAITGYASSVPEQGIHELYAFAAISLADNILCSKKLIPFTPGEGLNIQLEYTNQILELFQKILKR